MMQTTAEYDRVADGNASWRGDGARRLTAIGRAVGTALRFLRQALILCLLFGVGTVLAQALSLPLPGNLVGMLLLLFLLSVGIVRPANVQDLSGLAVKHFNFFFIPIVVGLMAWTTLLAASGLALGISLIGSAVVGLVAAGLATQLSSARGGPPDAA
jgi:holin-like protein